MMNYLLMLTCLIGPIVCHGQAGKTMQSRKLDITAFSINIPSEWSFDTTTVNTTVFKAKSPLENPSDDFQENLGVRVRQLQGNDLTLEGLMHGMEDALRKSMRDFQLLQKKKENVGHEKAESYVFTSRHDEFTICQKQVYMLRGNDFYVFTFTAKKDSFSAYLPSFNRILQSVRFK